MSATLHADPGPMARLTAVIAGGADTMSEIVRRITDTDSPETLRDVAKAWRVPLGKLCEWITEDRERAEQYANALRIASEQLALETVRIADAAEPEAGAVQKAKLQVDTRLKLASKLARDRFGDAIEHKHSGSLSLIAVLSSLPRGRVLEAETPAAVAETSLPKISEKKSEKAELI